MKSDRFLEYAKELVHYLASFQLNPVALSRNVAEFSLELDETLPAITLRIVTNLAKRSTIPYDDSDALVEDEIALDCETISTQADSAEVLETEVQITLHPVYQIPAPYITWSRWVSSGQLLNIAQFQNAVDSLHRFGSTPAKPCEKTHVAERPVRQPADNRTYSFGRLTQDNHPLTDAPCWSMHICMLEDIVRMSCTGEDRGVCANAGEEARPPVSVEEAQEGGLYLLNWLSLVGPHFGLAMSPEAYRTISAAI